MSSSDQIRKSLLSAVVMLFLVYLIAVPFYIYFEGLSLIDAIYFVSITITTVGYGDITPHTSIGKLFTIVVLFSGVSIFFYHVTHFGLFQEKALDPHVQRRLEILRNLTELQSGNVKKEEVRMIKDKLNRISQEHISKKLSK
ncbi:Voltage-gated potassium channel [Candidatus Bilamarchaeum dharawalense]|uniref:Voltage-gated potassium channel n=1 Tax=Candidatus Bilamarchaeum dharawalense TaxID=2885759 RepID=A0A5E4LQM1_9ARCH|nr:Voltage-gated potassium channel [Candidatus Bilamarchaeum dharawalense]